MLSTTSGLESYIVFCAGRIYKDRDSYYVKERDVMEKLQDIKINYQKIVHELEEISELQEKINKINSMKVNLFHDRKSDDSFANPIPFQEFQSTDDLFQKMNETKEKLKNDIKVAESLVKEVKEENGIECAEKVKKENMENAPTLLEEYAEYRSDDLYRYSPEFVNFSKNIADIQMEINIEAFESCNQLLADIRNDKLNLQQHTKNVKGIETGEHCVLYMTEYEHFYEGRDKSAMERNAQKIQQDGEYFKNMYDIYSKALNGEATKDEIDSLSDYTYLGNVSSNEGPKPSWRKNLVERVRRFFNREPKYLLQSEEEKLHDGRLLCLRGIYSKINESVGDNNIKPKKEKSDFEKSIEVDIEQIMESQKEVDIEQIMKSKKEVDIEQIMKSQKSEDEKSTEENKTKSGLKVIEEGPEFDD